MQNKYSYVPTIKVEVLRKGAGSKVLIDTTEGSSRKNNYLSALTIEELMGLRKVQLTLDPIFFKVKEIYDVIKWKVEPKPLLNITLYYGTKKPYVLQNLAMTPPQFNFGLDTNVVIEATANILADDKNFEGGSFEKLGVKSYKEFFEKIIFSGKYKMQIAETDPDVKKAIKNVLEYQYDYESKDEALPVIPAGKKYEIFKQILSDLGLYARLNEMKKTVSVALNFNRHNKVKTFYYGLTETVKIKDAYRITDLNVDLSQYFNINDVNINYSVFDKNSKEVKQVTQKNKNVKGDESVKVGGISDNTEDKKKDIPNEKTVISLDFTVPQLIFDEVQSGDYIKLEGILNDLVDGIYKVKNKTLIIGSDGYNTKFEVVTSEIK